MSVLEIQARVKARIWQAVAQSGVDTSTLPQEAMDSLVNSITEHMLAEMGTFMEETQAKVEAQVPAAPESSTIPATPLAPTEGEEGQNPPHEEPVLWEGNPFLSLGVKYQITTERVRIVEGILGKEREDIELVRIQHIDQSQTLAERLLNIGDIYIRSHDPTHPTSLLRDVRDVQEVHEILRRAVLDARKRNNLTYREEM
ncbi:MAG: PH domain-containing protein [Ardenticatenales bacterium]|nr:PH domain-containing protein [Ardenticatenales bacterium]